MSRENSSKFSKSILKQIKGTVCVNCGKNELDEINYHHIIPLSLGGNDIESNIVPLCSKCHDLLHFGQNDNGSFSHSQLIKSGIEKAKLQGKQIGRHTVTIENIPQTFKNYYYSFLKNKDKSITKASQELNLSRTTIYKYINILEKS